MIPRYSLNYGYLDVVRALAATDADHELGAAIARAYRAKHVFLLASGRSAIQLVLRAYARGGEVVVPGYTCHVVSEAVSAGGCTPIFADVGDYSTNMSAGAVKKAISPRTTAVMITHQFGLPCDLYEMLDICRRHGLLAIEDAAPALGASVDGDLVGSFGDAGILSFNMSKVLPSGMGGALVTNDDDLAVRVTRMIKQSSGPVYASSWRAFGRALAWKAATLPFIYPALRMAFAKACGDGALQYVSPPATPAPLDTRLCARCTAALFHRQFGRLAWNLERRRYLGDLYTRELSGLPGIRLPVVPKGALPAWIQYSIFVPDKQDFYRFALRRSIDLSWTFRYCTADSYGAPDCPNSRRAAQMVVGLPTYPSLSAEAAHRACSAVRQYAEARPYRAVASAS